jgi:hypothetical protein
MDTGEALHESARDLVVDRGCVRIDVALIDALLDCVAWRRLITRRDLVRTVATLAGVPFYAAAGFVTDIARWSSTDWREPTPVPLLIDTLLDLRLSLTVGRPFVAPVV